MYKSCSRCGKIHPVNYKCNVGKIYRGGRERKLRSTYKWTEKAEQIKRDSNYLCSICIEESIYTYEGLEVHHIEKVRDDETKFLDDYNLICLCTKHHKLADKGKIDKDYLLMLAKERVENTPLPLNRRKK